jgi:hypothetical protein
MGAWGTKGSLRRLHTRPSNHHKAGEDVVEKSAIKGYPLVVDSRDLGGTSMFCIREKKLFDLRFPIYPMR